MPKLILIAVTGVLLFGACTSDGDGAGDGGLVVSGPAVVDQTTIAANNTTLASTGTAAAEEGVETSTDSSDVDPTSSSADPVDTGTTLPQTTSTAVVDEPPATFAPYDSEIYRDPAHWVCRSDTDDVCDETYPLTEVAADGTLTELAYTIAEDPPVDCFYVYPTVSGDRTFNSDLVADSEIGTTQFQAARFNQVCSVYAPVYRSVTTGGLFGSIAGEFEAGWTMAYQDVLDAWRYYLANLNNGRPVIILGHSQGSFHLVTLLREEIDPDPAQRELIVSAIIAGASFQVAPGSDVGGDTQDMPLCHADDQVGCVITFQTYRDAVPPTAGALFGSPGANTASACTTPGALGGGSALLDGAYPPGDWVFAEPGAAEDITTTRVGLPGLVTGECKEKDGYNYLAVTINADPADPRADDIPGDGAPNWGLHSIDMNVAQDTLIALVRSQTAAYLTLR